MKRPGGLWVMAWLCLIAAMAIFALGPKSSMPYNAWTLVGLILIVYSNTLSAHARISDLEEKLKE